MLIRNYKGIFFFVEVYKMRRERLAVFIKRYPFGLIDILSLCGLHFFEKVLFDFNGNILSESMGLARPFNQ